ncbi:hypothetical protein F2P56_027742 [Juglans regia]|uniref:Endonuclease/exonuclease/phosphatase domain-containing protein n=1 Tax=Juglans regia TaxID=51240 RepID=A0A833T4S6_JUGRE|nr:hypothetical protein F2P56_027742 [Juglans regia]
MSAGRLEEHQNPEIVGLVNTKVQGDSGMKVSGQGVQFVPVECCGAGDVSTLIGVDGLVSETLMNIHLEECQSDYEVESENLKEDLQKEYSSESEIKKNNKDRKSVQKRFKPKILALAEPFLLEGRIPGFLRKFNCDYFMTNEDNEGKIWLLWTSDISVQKLSSSSQLLTVKVEEKGYEFILTIVYAKCNHIERKTLWANLEASGNSPLPWLICGDFNIIKDDSERRGGHPRQFTAMADFNLCIQNCGLLDMRYQGPSLGSHHLRSFPFGDTNGRRSFQTTAIIHELEQRIDSLEYSLQSCYNAEVDNDLMVANLN